MLTTLRLHKQISDLPLFLSYNYYFYFPRLSSFP